MLSQKDATPQWFCRTSMESSLQHCFHRKTKWLTFFIPTLLSLQEYIANDIDSDNGKHSQILHDWFIQWSFYNGSDYLWRLLRPSIASQRTAFRLKGNKITKVQIPILKNWKGKISETKMIGFNTSLGKFGKYASVKIDSIMPVLGMEQNFDKR